MTANVQSPERAKRKKHPEKALSAVRVRALREPGRYADGNGLYLHVDPSGAKRWILRTVIRGKRCDLGLGSAALVPLAEAREEALRLRKIARQGGDPLAERRKERMIVPTFEDAACRVHEALVPTFRNPKHAAQWIRTLARYVFPVFGSRPVDQIESRDVMEVLTPIWNERHETARRVRQRIRSVFDWAKASGFRSGDNPVDGTGKALPRHNGQKNHFAALPYADVPTFLAELRESASSVAAKLAFEFLILTVARTSEVLLAQWSEVDLAAKAWTVPADRMKAKVEHRVPLSSHCLALLTQAKGISADGPYIFPGRSPGRPLSNMVFLKMLRDMGRPNITVHGFRSSFRDWAEERTNTSSSVIEAALAHTVKSKVEAAYLPTKLLDKRRELMRTWAAFATAAPKEKVVRMREA